MPGPGHDTFIRRAPPREVRKRGTIAPYLTPGYQTMRQPEVALLGLGIMGSGMASSLLDAGIPATVFNRTRSRAEPLRSRGARIAATPQEAAREADVVISIVADDDASREIWLGEHGALSAMKPGSIAVESGTVTLNWIGELRTAAAGHGVDVLDAPVTGSRDRAAEGDLLFLVGGEAAVLERARPALAPMCRDILHVGPGGSGISLKLINNFLCGVQLASLGEAFAMVERAGLNLDAAMAVLTEGAPGSPLVRSLAARMATSDFTPHFHLELMVKDLQYAEGEGKRLGIDLRTAAAAAEVLRRAVAAGHGQEDMSAVVKQFR